MKETGSGVYHEVAPNGTKKVVGPFGVIDRDATVLYQRDTHTRQGTVAGDHITALPYWSEIDTFSAPDSSMTMRAYNGSIFDSAKWAWRVAKQSDWPWPNVTPATNTVRTYEWTLNVAKLAVYPALTLPTVSIAQWDLLYRLADTKALGNVRKAMINLPLLMKERRETLQLIGSKAVLIAKGAKALKERSLYELRKSKPRNKRELVKRLTSEHLAFVFGALPLISEVEGAIDFIEKDNLDFIRARGVQSVMTDTNLDSGWKGFAPSFNTVFFNNNWGTAKSSGSRRTTVSVRTALRYKLSSKIVGDAYALGFDPIGTGFDMIPLSFITGWVSNFDYWIRTLSPEIGLEFETGSRNRRTVDSFSVDVLALSGSTSMDVLPAVGKATVNGLKRRDERSVLIVAPESSLEWDVELGLYEIAAGISLTLQRTIKPFVGNKALKQFRYRGPRPKWLKDIRYTGRRL